VGDMNELIKILKQYNAIECTPLSVYRNIFSLGKGSIQKENEEPGLFKANPIAYFKNNNESKGHYRIMFDDTFEDTLKELQEADFAILNGLTYFGRKNLQEHASKMYALIVDLDGVNEKKLINFLFAAYSDSRIYPIPNYIVLSGHGLHLYYLFMQPIPLFPNIKLQLKEFKYRLTRELWNPYTSTIKQPQYQGINQGFRVIGGKTKIEGVRSRAFRLNPKKFDLLQLNEWVPEEFRVDEKKLWKESTMSLEEAKKKYPSWYHRRVELQEEKGHWICKEDLYNWWLRRMNEIKYGHRYFGIMCLAIYGIKCGIDKEKVYSDALSLLHSFNAISPENPFTEEDIKSAMECFDERYFTFPIQDISKLSALDIQKNKRNGRSQKVHLKGARAIQQINDEANGTNWRDGNGRKPKAELVYEWRLKNPNGKKADCIRDTNLSKPTVYKWWDYEELVDISDFDDGGLPEYITDDKDCILLELDDNDFIIDEDDVIF